MKSLSLNLFFKFGLLLALLFAHETTFARKHQKTHKKLNYCRAQVAPPQVDSDGSEVARQCSAINGKKQERSFSCIQWVAQQAEKAYEREPRCKNKVTAPLLMCIFKREVGRYSNNPCGKNGCGMSQFTSAGVSYVRQSFSTGLGDNYDYFWDLVGRPNEKDNKCVLNRRHALDRDTAVAMAATHLCAEAKHSGLKSSEALAQRYNGHPRYKYAYGRFVSNCVRTGLWKTNSPAQQVRVGVKSQCRRYKTCGGKKVGSRYSHSRRSAKHYGHVRSGNL
ncbi:MAG: hypothetical protein RJB66_1225 [Pseudomonadota bacterium]|jgi:hypothetical protein